jgi:hypothetical protein
MKKSKKVCFGVPLSPKVKRDCGHPLVPKFGGGKSTEAKPKNKIHGSFRMFIYVKSEKQVS